MTVTQSDGRTDEPRAGAPPKDHHYILIVHGTWSTPRANLRPWYSPDPTNPSSFCSLLATHLDGTDLAGAVWRPLQDGSIEFSWSGDNSHSARLEAAHALQHLIVRITQADKRARIHLVGHSHGGNVVLKAMEEYLRCLHKQGGDIAALAAYRFMSDRGDPDLAIRGAIAEVVGHERLNDFLTAPGVLKDLSAQLREDYERNHSATYADMIDNMSNDTSWITPGEFGVDRLMDPAGWPLKAERGAGTRSLYFYYFFYRFIPIWVQSRMSNRIGRVVFLGTPFYLKQWAKARGSGGFLRWGGRLFLSATFGLPLNIGAAFICMMFASFVIVPLGLAGLVPSDMAVALCLGIFLLMVIGSLLMMASENAGRPDTNPYIDDTWPVFQQSTPVIGGAALPYDGLTITAGHRDEAFLGLHAGPFLYAALRPELLKSLHPPLSLELRPRAPGETKGPVSFGERSIVGGLRWCRAVLARVSEPILRPVADRVFRRILISLVDGATMGLSTDDTTGGRVRVSRSVGAGRLIRETLWEIAPSRQEGKGDGASDQTVGVVKDPDSSSDAIASGFLWRRVKEGLDTAVRDPWVAANDPGLSEYETMAMEAEKLIKEWCGLIELSHSSYYADREVVGRIAAFLASPDEKGL